MAPPYLMVVIAVAIVLVSAARLALAADAPAANYREHATEYAGPGRDAPENADVREIRIGYFGPSDPADAGSGDLWCAAQMAVDEVNQAGGFQGKPLRLLSRWSDRPWADGATAVTRLAYQDEVWAIVGGMDGPTTHLAEQVAVKARLTLVNPVATDKTVNLANVPWMFSCLPGDHLLAAALASGIAATVGRKPFVLVSADDHDSHLFARELTKGLGERHLTAAFHFDCKHGSPDVSELAKRVAESKAEAAVLVAGAQDSARLLKAVRAEGFASPVFGGPAMGRRRFLEEAGTAAAGVVFPLLYDPQTSGGDFGKTFQTRFGRPADYAAAHTYEAVRLLAAAIRKAGLNRARIADAVRELSPWSGATGTIQWDPTGSNGRSVSLGTVRDGSVMAVSEPRP